MGIAAPKQLASVVPNSSALFLTVGKRPMEILKYSKNKNLLMVVKGETDYISDGNKLFFNKSGNSCMTKGGTGDILSGIIATQLSNGQNTLDSAIIGTYLMGKTGEIVYEKFGFQFMNSEFLMELAIYLKKFNEII